MLKKKVEKMITRPLKYTYKELQEKINNYFIDCDNNGEPYTITGLALYLDTTRKLLVEYEDLKEEYPDYQEIRNAIKKAKLKIENYAEKQLYKNSGNISGVIFNLKNNYGWKDRQEIDQTTKEDVTIKINLED